MQRIPFFGIYCWYPAVAAAGRERKVLFMKYTRQVLQDLQNRHPEQREFLQAAKEVLESLTPVLEKGNYEKKGLLERLAAENRIPAFLAGLLAGNKRGDGISHRILITHGKEYDVPGTRLLIRRASLWGADLVLYGHTHQFADSTGAGGRIRLINPGCLVGDPHMSYGISSRYEICSFAVLRIGTDREISVRHLHL
jgi:hypothetical protein